MHLDLATTSAAHQAELVARLQALGATPADVGQGDVPWTVLADPEGNEFCVLEPREIYRDTGPMAAVVVDCADPRAMARFWGEAMDWTLHEVTDDQAVLRSAKGVGPYLEFLRTPDVKTVSNRVHLDLRPYPGDDQEAEVARLRALGATDLDLGQGDVPWSASPTRRTNGRRTPDAGPDPEPEQRTANSEQRRTYRSGARSAGLGSPRSAFFSLMRAASLRTSAWVARSCCSHSGTVLLQRLDLLRGEGLGDSAARETRDGDAQLRRDHRPGVRAVASQFLQPLGRIGLQRVQLGARDDTLLELGGGGLEVHTQLLRRGRGLHRLGGLVRRHGVKGIERVRYLRPRPVTWPGDRLGSIPFVPARVRPGSDAHQVGADLERAAARRPPDPRRGVRRRGLRACCGAAAPTPGFVRLPVDRTDLSAIPLYTETTVVVVPKDHLVAAVDEVSAEDLADEIVLHPLDDTLDWERPPGRPAIERPATTADAIELVAAGVGLLVVPQSLARLHHRKDLTYRPVTDAPESRVALSWPQDETTDLVEEFIGIVRGRTVNSTRGRAPAPGQQPKDKRPASGGSRRQPTAGKPTPRGSRGGSGGGRNAKGGGRSGKPRRRS